ncbi:DUF3108 domain-containing protein [Ferruginibacter albus]|uniref:DUF3108 domain-containing protein n=1 Tax=Ferruginibacter albus TaxID=2875540 RepID=UPI001CC531B0|nr:DUF3108 domain-containing protein [Ferruginibacter albus]UAY51796.1 DUF3108 domain-containing protein [Ferruginibacter albus]
MKKLIRYALLMTCLCSFQDGPSDDFCGIKNTAFKEGESVTMKVFYTAAGVYVGAGEATFTTALEKYNGKTVYHCIGDGKSYSFFDNFFKVRDRYETYIDTSNMLPMKFVRNVSEGNTKIYNNVTFNQTAKTAITTNGVYKTTSCIQDVMSAIYYARNINFSKYKVNDKVPFDMFLDDQVYHLYIRYLGKEVVKTKYGKFNAIKFKPLLIKGTMFEGGEKMTAWVSDDPNHLLLRIESPITVGTVKVDMYGYKNLRYPLSSLIEVR